MRNLWQDVRYAARMLLKSRAFTLVAVVLLVGLGIFDMVSYSVAQRTHKIGVLIALGARQRLIR